ncbi:MAG TPA: hypothetical protein VMB75_09900 [Rhodocyclaceae bacterium]|nr:hypothetical protein [Rhodocyclaceae bacterium]
MIARRDARCPLCGAPLTAVELLDAVEEFADLGQGVLAARCPHCQGYLELQPDQGRLDVGYLGRAGQHFVAVLGLPVEDLRLLREVESGAMTVVAGGRRWQFRE